MPFDLFVSYAEADSAWVQGYLLDALRAAGVTCQVEAAFALGVPRLAEFERAVTHSRHILLVLSPAYFADNATAFVDVLAQSFGLESATWPVIPLVLHPVKLPPRLAMLVGLDVTDAAKQHKAVARLLDDLKKPAPAATKKSDCPYPGMRAFDEASAAQFFGRDGDVEELVNMLRLSHFAAVIGPSGSGKSSLVFAGLLPRLRTSGLFGPDDWSVAIMRPGEAPLAELNRTLGVADARAFRPAQRTLLIVDQFEEAFTLAPKETVAKEAAAFASALIDLVAAGVYIVITARSDFYSDLMTSPLWPQIRAHRAEIAPLDAASLRQAIVHPAEDAGVFVESALVERLAADAAGEPGVLPLLQETMVLLWDKLERRYLPLRAYESLALVLPHTAYDRPDHTPRTGLQVAMASRADTALKELTPDQQTIARRIFLRLVQFGEGRADTRRQQTVEQLRVRSGGVEDAALFDRTLQHFVDRRLLTESSAIVAEGAPAEQRVDLAHEALIAGWPKFQEWLVERRDAELARRRLEAKATEWVRLGSGSAGLLDLTELKEADQWFASREASDLGSSDDLMACVKVSRKLINPGWRGSGTLGLVVGGASAVALVALAFLFAQDAKPTAVRDMIEVALVAAVVLAVAVSGLLRRGDPYRWQRLSHELVRRWPAWVAVGVAFVVAAGLWGLVGVSEVKLRQDCLAYQTPSSYHVAINTTGLDSYYAELISTVLSHYTDVRAWALSDGAILHCQKFFTQRVTLELINLPDGTQSYMPRIDPPVTTTSQRQTPSTVFKIEDCATFTYVAHDIAEMIVPRQVAVVIKAPASPVTCQALDLNERGRIAYKNKQFADAEAQFRNAISITNDSYATARNNLGLVFLMEGHREVLATGSTRFYGDALAEFRRAVELRPAVWLLHDNVGQACFDVGDLECARQNYEKAAALDQNIPDPHLLMAELLTRQGAFDQAQVQLDLAWPLIELTSPEPNRWDDEAKWYLQTAILRYEQGRWDDALESLDKPAVANSQYFEQAKYYTAATFESRKDKATCAKWKQFFAAERLQTKRQPAFGQRQRREDARQRAAVLHCPP